MKKEGSLLTGLITVVAVLAVLSLGISGIMRGCSNKATAPSPTPATSYPDPLILGYDHPNAVQTADGYYLTATDTAGNAVLFFADTAAGLATAKPKTLEGVTGAVTLYRINSDWLLLGADGAQYTCAGDDPYADAWSQTKPGEAGVTTCAIVETGADERLLVTCGASGVTLTKLEGLEITDQSALIAQPKAQPVISVSSIVNDKWVSIIYVAGEGGERAAYMVGLDDPANWDDADNWVIFSMRVFASDAGLSGMSFVKDGENGLFIYDQSNADGQPIIRAQQYTVSTTGLPVFGLPKALN